MIYYLQYTGYVIYNYYLSRNGSLLFLIYNFILYYYSFHVKALYNYFKESLYHLCGDYNLINFFSNAYINNKYYIFKIRVILDEYNRISKNIKWKWKKLNEELKYAFVSGGCPKYSFQIWNIDGKEYKFENIKNEEEGKKKAEELANELSADKIELIESAIYGLESFSIPILGKIMKHWQEGYRDSEPLSIDSYDHRQIPKTILYCIKQENKEEIKKAIQKRIDAKDIPVEGLVFSSVDDVKSAKKELPIKDRPVNIVWEE